MKNREHDGNQQGAQTHGEGTYGDAGRQADLDRIHQSERQADGAGDDQEDSSRGSKGRHRLDEDRQQHDDADLQSEQNRERDR